MTNSPIATDAATTTVPHVFTRDGYHLAEDQYLTASEIKGPEVHGRDDAKIGAIRALTVGANDAITGAIVDIGGFLGIGMHSILVPFGDLTVLRKTIGTDLHVSMDATEDQLKAMPHYNE